MEARMSQSTEARAENPAEFYERFMVPVFHGPFAADLVERVRPRPGERVLDLACGTGIVARAVARALGGDSRITGLDISPLMLEVARQKASAEGFEIEWREGDAQALPFDDASFDLVLCQEALQLVPDMQAAAREMWRVLAPGGRIAVSAWTTLERNPFDKVVADAFTRHAGAPVIDVAFALGDPAVFSRLFADAGFEDIDIQTHSVAGRFPSPDEYVELMVVSAVAAIPAISDMDETEQQRLADAIQADVRRDAEPFIENGELVVMSETGILQARKPG
jgi:ubiquinone/menaquinone biosynthesis C-methylase UbiE